MDPLHLHPAVKGASYRPEPARVIMRELEVDDRVDLVREKTNKYDENAIKVVTRGEHIGYIQRDIAELLAPFLDNGEEFVGVVETKLDPLTPILRLERT